MRLKRLDAFNRDRAALHAHNAEALPNGIACPSCGAELVDSQPGVTLTSNPPHVRVACRTCGYAGTRIA